MSHQQSSMEPDHEIGTGPRRKQKTKPYRIKMAIKQQSSLTTMLDRYWFQRYRTKRSAEEALKALKKNPFYSKHFDMTIA